MRKLRALIVDDSITIRKIIKANLNKLGITTVYEAVNGDDGFKVACSVELDVAFVDFNMPGLNGLELTEKLRATPKTTGLKIVAVSSEFDHLLMDRFKEMGVFDFIEKPFDLTKFNNAIKPVLTKEISGDDEHESVKLTPDMLARLFAQTPQTTIDEKNIMFQFGNEKVTMSVDRFITFASHSLDIPQEESPVDES